jgi:2-pyrone-4,6-dicarboxylate lactonase
MRLIEGAWDCHAHIIDDPARYPLAKQRSYDPPRALLDDYLTMLDRFGIERGFLVQPSVYGFDNSCMLDALDRADGRLLGIAVPSPETTHAELEALHRRGVRGVRCNLLYAGGLDIPSALQWQPALRALDWHVVLHLALEDVDDVRALVERFTVPVVVDHMGRPAPGRTDPSVPQMRNVIELVREGACFVKLSAPYRLSHEAPPWRDVVPLARALAAANPDACLWGSDWPHTDTHASVRTVDLLDALETWCSDGDVLRRVTTAADARLWERAQGPGHRMRRRS